MTSSWSAIPLGVSAVAAAFACLVVNGHVEVPGFGHEKSPPRMAV
jgi:hypothetical protein